MTGQGTTVGIRYTAEQIAAVDDARGNVDRATWIREVSLAVAGRPDLGVRGVAARVEQAIPAGLERGDGQLPMPANPSARPIETLELPTRVLTVLERHHDVRTIGDVLRLTHGELKRSPNMGPKGIDALEKALAPLGLQLGSRR